MSKAINATVAALFAVSAVWAVPAIAGAFVNGGPCTVGQTNCVQDDPDDATKGHTVIPTGQTSSSMTNGDSGVVTTSPPTPTPAPTPGPGPD